MTFDLCTIDWTAVGSIVTFIAMIIAYWTIHLSNKQNKENQQFQLLLIQREIEQKRLDDLIEHILVINDSIQPVLVLDLSIKLINGSFTEENRHFVDSMAAQDRSNGNKLSVQLEKYERKPSAKKVLQLLSNQHNIYMDWLADLSLLYLYKYRQEDITSDINKIISNIASFVHKFEPSLDKHIQEVLNERCNDLDKAIHLMNVYCYAVSSYLVDKKKAFEKEVCVFVRQEQQRIDNIVVGENK